jgi:uncharacterized DUF497 family protein
MAFEWHSKKAERNLKDHGVSFQEAATAFEDPFAEFLPDLAHSVEEFRYNCFGSSTAGRLLIVSFTERGNEVRIISAREMEPKEKRIYETRNPFT